MELIVLAPLRAGNYVLVAVGFALVFGSLRILNLAAYAEWGAP